MKLFTEITFLLSIFISKSIGSEYDYMAGAEKFKNAVIIPYLMERNMTDLYNISDLRFCRCSASDGCTSLTEGLTLNYMGQTTAEERNIWMSACITDGVCFQHAVSGRGEAAYGCIDAKIKQQRKNSALKAMKYLCMNKTDDPLHEELWVCCSNGHYCGNQTVLTPKNVVPKIDDVDDPPSFSKFLIFAIMSAIFIVLAALVFLIVYCIFPEKYIWTKMRFCHLFYDPTHGVPVSESNTNADNISDTPSTVLTPIGTRDTTFNCSTYFMTEQGDTRNLLKLLNDLDTTTGSGSGQPVILQPRTIAQQIRLEACIGTGRFGSVYSGNWQEEKVAVKIFQSSDETAFCKEVSIYENLLRHPNLLRYISSDRIDEGVSIGLWLITEYHEKGSLQEYLSTHTVSFLECYRFLESAAAGLRFLHLEFQGRKSSEKRGIAHRDLKSRNIMVKNELTCVIGDFGLSVIADSDDEFVGNKMCGTPRYMAPEILEGKFGNYYFETCCRADIYSFSLVIWEVLQRCEGEGITAKPPAESIPYWDKIGRDPTPEEMKGIASITRPPIRTAWTSNSKLSKLVNTMRAAWNPSPSSRPGALNLWRELSEGMKQVVIKEQARPSLQFWPASSRTIAAIEEEGIQMQEIGPNASKKRKLLQNSGDEQRTRLLEQ